MTILSSNPDIIFGDVKSVTAVEAVSSQVSADTIYLSQAGREGQFRWDNSDLSSAVAIDIQQGIYIAPSSDATGASGAWIRQYEGPISPRWFGAKGDGVSITGNCTISSGAAALTVAGASFTSDDVGKYFEVPGACSGSGQQRDNAHRQYQQVDPGFGGALRQ